MTRSAGPEFSGECPVNCTRERASRSEQPSRGEPGVQRTEDRPWDVGKRSYTDEQKALFSDAFNEAPWGQVVHGRHVTAPADQALEKENRVPRMGGNHNKPATRADQAPSRRKRLNLIRQMAQSSDEQHDIEPALALAAEACRILNAELETVIWRRVSRALDHRWADVNSDAEFDDRQQLN
jgi:hypothetical protein